MALLDSCGYRGGDHHELEVACDYCAVGSFFRSRGFCDVDAVGVLFGISFVINKLIPHGRAIALRAELCGTSCLARVADKVKAMGNGLGFLALSLRQLKRFALVAVALYVKHGGRRICDDLFRNLAEDAGGLRRD